MFDKILVKNIGSLFGIKLAGYVIPLITLPYLVRTLGIESYGYLGFSIAIVQYFVLFVNYGFDLSATSHIAKNGNDKQSCKLYILECYSSSHLVFLLRINGSSCITSLYR